MPSGNRPTRDPHTRPAIHTLERLHSELGGQILENKQRHQELSEQMRHVEACIKLLDPSYNLVVHHSDFDVLIPSHSRIGRLSGGTRISMLLGTPG